eukprot:UN27598
MEIMMMYYPTYVKIEDGPTDILPGTQYITNCNGDGLNFVFSPPKTWNTKSTPALVRGGSLVFVHFDLWHRRLPNISSKVRYMFKWVALRTSLPTSTPSWNHSSKDWIYNSTFLTKKKKNSVLFQWKWMLNESFDIKNFEIYMDEKECKENLKLPRKNEHQLSRNEASLQLAVYELDDQNEKICDYLLNEIIEGDKKYIIAECIHALSYCTDVNSQKILDILNSSNEDIIYSIVCILPHIIKNNSYKREVLDNI